MFIKTVIIDGFKSYGKRTEITGFDSEFTAITGLNGTGKSNVLDAICFVLGISNLTQVRATSLQELVYKGGQCGVTKATVTLIFNNSDAHQCPPGYDTCRDITVARQVIVGGKNKYMINGKIVLQKKVIDLFCSVKLNINNPNFLIMQGRITKVLNMRPIEILSMIEEAAGTSMYETKREDTAKLMATKDGKINEINHLLQEEIVPKLNKLRDERETYINFQKLVREIDYMKRIYISYKYLKQKEALAACEQSVEKATGFIDASQLKMIENDKQCVQIDQECQLIQQQIDQESGGTLRDLEADLTEASKGEAVANASKKGAETELASARRALKMSAKSIVDDEKTLTTKQQEMDNVGGLFDELRLADEEDAKSYADAKKRYEAISSGLAMNEDGEAASLQDQLITAKKIISESETAIKQSNMELKHVEAKFRTKSGESKSNDASYLKDKREVQMTEATLAKLQANLSQIDYTDGTLEQLEHRKNDLQEQRRVLRQQIDRSGGHRYELKYQDPEQNFDRSRVFGMLCMLFDVRDAERNSLALGMCAGGSLYSVVTDTDVTSKLILQHGKLMTRTTFMPMNKISYGTLAPNIVDTAQRLVGKENVSSAISLLDYPPHYERAIQHIFGRVLICSDLNIAKQVTYHPQIRTRSVTLDGDVLEPEGTLSGGARPTGGAVLLEVAKVKELTRKLACIEDELRAVLAEILEIKSIAEKWNQLKEQLDLQMHELSNAKARLSQSSHQQHQQELDELKAQIETLNATIVTARETEKKNRAKVADIESKLADAKGYRERELKSATEAMKQTKKRSELSQKKWKQREQEFETLKMNIEELGRSIKLQREQVTNQESTIKQLEQKLAEMSDSSNNSSAIVADLNRKIREQKDKIAEHCKEIKQRVTAKKRCATESAELQIEIKKKQTEINKLKAENKDGFAVLADLEEKYTWIANDKVFFGGKNTRYDYSKEDPLEVGKKLATAQAKKAKMERNVNVKAMMMLEREEKQYEEVEKRKAIIEEDKKKITAIIVDLDAEKKEQVKEAWQVVSANFGSIFSSLLPGAQATLVPAQNNDFLSGLTVRVGFNGLWKESLNELSGGQRSLVALSLILAMLKYKPAPLYILDEVDAALDMSHTQNIGNMLKEHFKNSQFIIVSLKDGMFNNANVLFKTKFEDGVSCVTRTVNAQSTRK